MTKKVHLIEAKQLSRQLGVRGGGEEMDKSECEGEKWVLERGEKLSTGNQTRNHTTDKRPVEEHLFSNMIK